MSNEVKVGILALVAIFMIVWGYNFIKGRDIFSTATILYAEYNSVDGLAKSAPITINGFQIGVVGDIWLREDFSGVIVVRLEIERGIKIPKTTVARITSSGLLSGKSIELVFDGPCAGDDCAVTGDYLQGRVAGMLETLTGGVINDENTQAFLDMLDSLFNVETSVLQTEVRDMISNVSRIMNNLASTTATLDTMMTVSSKRITSILHSSDELARRLSTTSHDIEALAQNLNQISSEVKDAGLGETIIKTRETISSADARLKQLEETLTTANQSMAQLRDVMQGVTDGQGTLGKLIQDPALYENLNRTSQNLDLLLQDIRLNPKRYTRILSRRQIEYTVPEDDPALGQ